MHVATIILPTMHFIYKFDTFYIYIYILTIILRIRYIPFRFRSIYYTIQYIPSFFSSENSFSIKSICDLDVSYNSTISFNFFPVLIACTLLQQWQTRN